MNILFTCAGRRNYLLQFFRETLGQNGRIIAADMQVTAPAMAAADRAVVVPEVYSTDYVDTILNICQEEQVDALFSLNDLELPILASAKGRFDKIGVKLVISNEKVIDICFDKYKTVLFCEQLKINTPKTFLMLDESTQALAKGNLKLPVIVKPRWGSASLGIESAETIEELELSYRLISLKLSKSILYESSKQHLDKAVMIQEKINGVEYGLDILNDFSGRTVAIYVKEKLAMRAGETDKAVLRNKPELEELGLLIGRQLGHIGNLDCDIFESEGKYFLLEMNPRFGGGYPFSHIAGADYPAAIVAWISGLSYDFAHFTRIYDQPFAKCDTLIKVLK